MRKKNQFRRQNQILAFVLLFASAFYFIACGAPEPTNPDPTTINPAPKPGQTEFETDEMNGGGYGSPENSDGRASPSAKNSGSAAPGGGGTQAAPPAPGAPSGRTGTVEEADLYRVSGNLLYYLNTYKGLIIFDMTNPKAPVKLSNLPVFGYPIEMFVENKIAYALVKDALYLIKINGKFEFKRYSGSQMLTIDISNPKKPKVLQRLNIKGSLREGVSRKIDKTIYVVSYRPKYYWWGWSYNRSNQDQTEQATVYSFNVENPKQIKMVQSLELLKLPKPSTSGNSGSTSGGGMPKSTTTRENNRFQGVTISATANTLLVGQNWQYSKSSSNSGDRCGYSYENYQKTKLSVIDISDPKGTIRIHTKFEVRGRLSDQFKQTYIYDKKKKQGVYLGIFQRNEWKSKGCSRGQRVVKNNLISIDVSNGKNPKVLDTLQFGKPNEQVRGSLFDRERSVAYAITAVRTDPLYALSYKDPSNLKVLSAVDGLSGDINLFRFINKRKFLLAIGRDNTGHCTGFEGGENGARRRFATRLAVSIIDVRSLSKVRLVQRKCIYVEGARWSNSAVNWNLDQAHKMIGMYSDSKVNLLTVPVNYSVRSKNGSWRYYEYKSAVGIVKWDLSKYDDTKDEKHQNVLENIATVIHPKGSVKRTIIFKLPQGKSHMRSILNLSDTHLSLVNIDNIKKPTILSTFEIAPYIRTVYRFGNYVVEQLNLSRYDSQYNEFRVKKLGAATNINDAKVITSFKIGQIRNVIKWGENLILFRYKPKAKQNGNGRVQYDYNNTEVRIYSFKNPEKPVALGVMSVPFSFYPRYYFYCGGFWGAYYFSYFGGNTQWLTTKQGLVTLLNHYDQTSRTSSRKLLFMNFSDLKSPSYKTKTLISGKNIYQEYHNLVKGNSGKEFYLTTRKSLRKKVTSSGGYRYSFRYYTSQWTFDGTLWKTGKAINIPGRLLRAYKGETGQTMFLTYDTGYIKREYVYSNGNKYQRWQQIFRLYILEKLSGRDLARLKDFKTFNSWQLHNLLLSDGYLYISARRDWYHLQKNKKQWNDLSDNLMIFDLRAQSFDQKLIAPTRTYGMQISGIYKNRLILNLPGSGLLLVDVQNPKSPKALHFERTLGWVRNIEFSGDKVLVAAGHFGIYELNISKVSIPSTPL